MLGDYYIQRLCWETTTFRDYVGRLLHSETMLGDYYIQRLCWETTTFRDYVGRLLHSETMLGDYYIQRLCWETTTFRDYVGRLLHSETMLGDYYIQRLCWENALGHYVSRLYYVGKLIVNRFRAETTSFVLYCCTFSITTATADCRI